MGFDRVLVTGGLGFIGSRLCEALLRQGRSVVCVDDLSGRYAKGVGSAAAVRLRKLGVEVVIADARTALPRDVQAVLHLAGRPGVRTRHPAAELFAANAELTEHLVAASGARVVLASTSSIYGNAPVLPSREDATPAPLNPYAASKLAAERKLLDATRRGGEGVIVRLFTVYGPGQRPDMAFARWLDALTTRRPLPWYAAPGTARDFTYVDDAVAGLIAALDRGRTGEAYNVSGGRSVDLAEALALVEDALGRDATLDRRATPGAEALVTHGCVRKSAAELGYAPGVDLVTGLRRQVAAVSSPPLDGRGRALAVPRRSGWGSGGAVRGSGSHPPVALPAAASSRG